MKFFEWVLFFAVRAATPCLRRELNEIFLSGSVFCCSRREHCSPRELCVTESLKFCLGHFFFISHISHFKPLCRAFTPLSKSHQILKFSIPHLSNPQLLARLSDSKGMYSSISLFEPLLGFSFRVG